MGDRHRDKLTKYLHAEAKGGVYISEVVDPYKKPNENPYRTVTLMRRRDTTSLASMRYQALPGCCGVLLLHNFAGSRDGVRQLVEIGRRAAARAKFGLVLLSLTGVPEAQIAALTTFNNPKTGNDVTVYGIPTGATHERSTPLEDRE